LIQLTAVIYDVFLF